MTSLDVVVVSYGPLGELDGLLASLRAQSAPPRQIVVWHNGPSFADLRADALGADVRVLWEAGQNHGFGGGAARGFAATDAELVVVANPDLTLAPGCLAELRACADADPDAATVGALLLDGEGRINAHGLSLTHDLVGVNRDRGRAPAAVSASECGDDERCVGPSGALFLVRRSAWERLGGGPLFPDSLFLYLEDLAFGLRIRGRGGRVRFAPGAHAVHAFSQSTGKRSALKVYHVERNRLWLLRALRGDLQALARMAVTAGRYAAYALAGSRGSADASGASAATLARALLRGWRDGFTRPVPPDLYAYLDGVTLAALPRSFFVPWREQLRDPTA